ncbi:MAG: ribosome small subunit-dependent GTPase A [Defluviitaleaceae bacterium]|nr:ribosome small subunit-dependent GTPase A [Defluviitaleaceae bacterium]
MRHSLDGRVIKAVGGLYTVATEHGRYDCNVRGIFRKHGFTPLVGDYAVVEKIDEQKKTGTVTKFRERKTELVRPRVANVDQAVIVLAAADPPVNPDLTDRLLLLAEERGLEIVICVNKIDLDDQYATALKPYESAGYGVFFVSAKTGGGISGLRAALAGKVSVLAGPSGVGKSSIINSLTENETMQTGEISRKLGRGKHTTRHAELIEISDGMFVVDTPGFSSLELKHIPRDILPGLFPEFRPYLDGCRFNDCRHINEPDCAVKAQTGAGISAERYDRYVMIWNEIGDNEWT